MKAQVVVSVGPFQLKASKGRQRPARGEVHLALQTMRGDGFPASEAALDLLQGWLGDMASTLPPASPAKVARAILDELRRYLREEWPKGRAWGPAGAFRLVQVQLVPPDQQTSYAVTLPAEG